MNISIQTEGNEIHPVNKEGIIFNVSKICLAVVTLLAGLGVILGVIKNGCRNGFVIIIILMTGLLLELYCFVKTHESQNHLSHATSVEEFQNSCADVDSPALVANSVVILTLTLSAISRNILDSKIQLRLQNCLLMFPTFASVGLIVMHTLSKPKFEQNPVLATDTSSFYFSICLQDIEQAILPFLSETILLYFPLLAIVFLIHRSLKVKDSTTQKGAERRQLRFTHPCNKHTVDRCRLCEDIDSIFSSVLCFYAVVLLIIRPGLMVYDACSGDKFRDFLPAFAGVMQYMMIVIKCLSNLFHNDKSKESNEKNDYTNLEYSEKEIVI